MAKRTSRKVVKRRPALRGAHMKGVMDHLKNLERFAKLRRRKRGRKR
jgi:hypothetical protein